MKIKLLAAAALIIAASFSADAQPKPQDYGKKAEGVALTPPMGWNSYNKFGCGVTEELVRQTADALVETGLAAAGYVYLNLDDGWHGTRDSLGFISADPEKFPSGMKAVADYVHSKGLKIGIYSDAGWQTCGGWPGSAGHEYQDALTYAKWGIDYLKYDWCAAYDLNAVGAYKLMRDALDAAGRPVVFSICEWGSNKPWEWAENVGHLWRTTGDITCAFGELIHYDGWSQNGVLGIIDKNKDLRKYAGPGHWNDPDMLEVGNGMPVNEDRAHFTMWCMLAAPLILGNDVTNMSQETFEIITNMDVIAIDQDPLGIQGLMLKEDKELGLEFWFKPFENGDWAFTILNRSTEDAEYTINWEDFNFTDELCNRSTDFTNITYSYKDLWTKKTGKTKKAKTVTIPSHDVVCYRLSPIEK